MCVSPTDTKHVWANSVFNLRKNIPLISLYSISASENLDHPMQSHSIPWYIPIHTTTPNWYVGNLTNSAPSTEVIPNACSKNWLRPSPWSNVGLAKIPKAFRQSGRGRSQGRSGLVGGGRSWQTRGVLQKLGDTQTVNLNWSWKETGLARPYPFIRRHAHLLSLVFL